MMFMFDFLYRIARRAGHQGACCLALTTGRTKPLPFLSRFQYSFFLAWFNARCCFSPTQLIFLGQLSTQSNTIN
jgi:hypothetical protein